MSRDLDEVLQRIADRGFHHVRMGGFDLDGVLRGKYVSLDKFISSAKNGLGFCNVIFGWDMADKLYEDVGVTYTGWHTGYPDAHARVELESFRWVPWEDGIPFALFDFYTADGDALPVSPRQALRRVLGRAEALGYRPLLASEFEFFLFRETADTLRDKGWRNLQAITPGMFGYSALRASANGELVRKMLDHLRAFDIPVEGLHTETGPGVYEIAIAYGDALESADRASLAKTAIKEICTREGIQACFMAKWNEDLPGSSGHTHQSVWDLDLKANLFADAKSPRGMSQLFRWYIGGLLDALPELTAMFCPNINSYKRLVPGFWAPTRVCWGTENRTTTLRVIPGTHAKHMRVENRVVGADANPYLAYAATLAAGLHGIENKIEPPAPLEGNAYEAAVAGGTRFIPASLHEATDLFRKSAVARKYLGDAFVDHFAATRDWEVRQYQKAVTEWELQRYFELA